MNALDPVLRSESGFSLVEVIVALGIVTLVMVPLFSWVSLAFKQEAQNQGRLKDTASTSYIDRRFADDVAGSTAVSTGPTATCAGLPASATPFVAFTVADTNVVYASTADRVIRQVCGGTSETVLEGVVASPAPTATCTPATGQPDRCREVTFRARIANSESGRAIEIPVRRRITDPAGVVG